MRYYYKGCAPRSNMDAKTARTISRKSARNHYLGALYHNAFYAPRTGTYIGNGENEISTMDANTLIRNGMAMIHFNHDNGRTWIGRTKKGSKIYDASASARTFHINGGSTLISEYPRYVKNTSVDILEVMNAINKAHPSGILRRL